MLARFRSWLVPLLRGAAGLLASLLFTVAASAQDEAPPDDSGRWATGYLLVILCIVLGLASILVTSKRTTELRRYHEED